MNFRLSIWLTLQIHRGLRIACFAAVPDRRDGGRRDAARRRVLSLFSAHPQMELSLAFVSAAVLLPVRVCVRILRRFEAVGLIESTPSGFRTRRRTSS